MKRRHHSLNTFPNLDTFIEAFIVLATIYGIPYLLGYFSCKLIFSGSPEDCKEWGSLIMICTPIFFYLVDRVLNIFNIYCDKD